MGISKLISHITFVLPEWGSSNVRHSSLFWTVDYLFIICAYCVSSTTGALQFSSDIIHPELAQIPEFKGSVLRKIASL